jgi:non-canonical poly(A) RNA polymerase PAPD5/7
MYEIIKKYPFIKDVVLLIKSILRHHKLNEAYTGGIGSYVIFHLIYSYILLQKRNDNKNINNYYEVIFFNLKKEEIFKNYGTFLKGFFAFIAYEFDYLEHGINNLNEGELFPKEKKEFFDDALVILSPFDLSVNIAKSSHRFSEIKKLFKYFCQEISYIDNNLIREFHNLENNIRNGLNPIFYLNKKYGLCTYINRIMIN